MRGVASVKGGGDWESTSFHPPLSLLFREQAGVGTTLARLLWPRYASRFLNIVSVRMLYSLQITTTESQLMLRTPRMHGTQHGV